MEINTNHLLIFDACSFINLINIDYEHQEIIKYLEKHFDFRFPERVENEIRNNAKNKVASIEVRTEKDKEYKKDFDEYIDILLGSLWNNVSQEIQIKKDLGQNIYDELAKIIGHKSKEGEWYCIAHSLYLSRLHQTRLALYTDDYPAINEYQGIFKNQKIGLIEDTSDFFVLLFWTCPEVDRNKLKRYLRDLYSEYKRDVNQLLKKVREFRDQKLSAQDTHLRIKISEFEQLLANLKLTNLKLKKEEVLGVSGRFKKPLNKLFAEFDSVFDLTNDYNLLNKIETLLNYLEENKIFKIY